METGFTLIPSLSKISKFVKDMVLFTYTKEYIHFQKWLKKYYVPREETQTYHYKNCRCLSTDYYRYDLADELDGKNNLWKPIDLIISIIMSLGCACSKKITGPPPPFKLFPVMVVI